MTTSSEKITPSIEWTPYEPTSPRLLHRTTLVGGQAVA